MTDHIDPGGVSYEEGLKCAAKGVVPEVHPNTLRWEHKGEKSYFILLQTTDGRGAILHKDKKWYPGTIHPDDSPGEYSGYFATEEEAREVLDRCKKVYEAGKLAVLPIKKKKTVSRKKAAK